MATTRTIEIKTELPGPRSREILERKAKVIADPLSIYLPIVIAEGRGSTLTDVDGNVFIDFTGGVGCLNVGHSHPQVVAAAQEQLERFAHTDFTIVPYEVYVTLAERLLERAPFSGPAKAAFFNAGTEAVENAVKFARAYTGRPAVIAFEGAFHGRTLLSLSLTSKTHPYKAGLGPFAPEVYRVPFPQRLPRAERGGRARRARAGVLDAGRGRVGRGDRRRARPGRGRLRRRSEGVHARAARALRPARDRPDRRRGADGLRAHREAVRDRALRDRARPDDGREVDRRRAAALGRARQGRDHGRAGRLRGRRHLRRQPGRAGGGARRPRRDRGGGRGRARRAGRRDDPLAHARVAGALPADRRRPRPRRDAGDRARPRPGHEGAGARPRDRGRGGGLRARPAAAQGGHLRELHPGARPADDLRRRARRGARGLGRGARSVLRRLARAVS